EERNRSTRVWGRMRTGSPAPTSRTWSRPEGGRVIRWLGGPWRPGMPPRAHGFRGSMDLTAHLPAERRQHVERRLRSNLMAWLTTVRPDGQPVSVPVWFLVRGDGTILVYSQPGQHKLRNISKNPRVSLALDVNDL